MARFAYRPFMTISIVLAMIATALAVTAPAASAETVGSCYLMTTRVQTLRVQPVVGDADALSAQNVQATEIASLSHQDPSSFYNGTVFWEPVAGVDGYVVSFGTAGVSTYVSGAGSSSSSFVSVLGSDLASVAVSTRIGAVDGAPVSCLDLTHQEIPVCSFVVDATGVDVTWTPVDGADRYVIRRTVNGGALKWTGAAIGTDSSSFRDGLPTAGATAAMTYTVETKVGTTYGPRTTCANNGDVIPEPGTQQVPECSFAVDAAGVNVTWTPVTNVDKYIIRRTVNGGALTWTGAVGGAATASFVDDLPSAGANAPMTYTVETKAAGINGPQTACTNAGTVPPEPGTQQVPACTFLVDATGIDVAWTAVTGVDKYVIRRTVNGGTLTWTGAADGATASAFRDGLAAAGQFAIYTFTVETNAANIAGPQTSCTNTGTAPPTPGSQTVPECSFVADATGVDVMWTPVDNVDKYVIRRTVNGGTLTWTGAVDGATSSTFRDGLPPDPTAAMTYTVETKAANVNSAQTTCSNTPVEQPHPTRLCNAIVEGATAYVGWEQVPDASGYIVTVSVDGTAPVQAAELDNGAQTFAELSASTGQALIPPVFFVHTKAGSVLSEPAVCQDGNAPTDPNQPDAQPGDETYYMGTLTGNPYSSGLVNGRLEIAAFNEPFDVVAPNDFTLFVSDRGNDMIRRIDLLTETVENYGAVTDPTHIAYGPNGALYILSPSGGDTEQATGFEFGSLWKLTPGSGQAEKVNTEIQGGAGLVVANGKLYIAENNTPDGSGTRLNTKIGEFDLNGNRTSDGLHIGIGNVIYDLDYNPELGEFLYNMNEAGIVSTIRGVLPRSGGTYFTMSEWGRYLIEVAAPGNTGSCDDTYRNAFVALADQQANTSQTIAGYGLTTTRYADGQGINSKLCGSGGVTNISNMAFVADTGNHAIRHIRIPKEDAPSYTERANNCANVGGQYFFEEPYNVDGTIYSGCVFDNSPCISALPTFIGDVAEWVCENDPMLLNILSDGGVLVPNMGMVLVGPNFVDGNQIFGLQDTITEAPGLVVKGAVTIVVAGAVYVAHLGKYVYVGTRHVVKLVGEAASAIWDALQEDEEYREAVDRAIREIEDYANNGAYDDDPNPPAKDSPEGLLLAFVLRTAQLTCVALAVSSQIFLDDLSQFVANQLPEGTIFDTSRRLVQLAGETTYEHVCRFMPIYLPGGKSRAGNDILANTLHQFDVLNGKRAGASPNLTVETGPDWVGTPQTEYLDGIGRPDWFILEYRGANSGRSRTWFESTCSRGSNALGGECDEFPMASVNAFGLDPDGVLGGAHLRTIDILANSNGGQDFGSQMLSGSNRGCHLEAGERFILFPNSFYMDVLELRRSSDEEIRDDLREADSLRICGVHQDRVS